MKSEDCGYSIRFSPGVVHNQNDIDLSEGEFEIIDGDDDQNINIMDIIYFINIIIN